MLTLYTSSSPWTNAYSNFHHFYELQPLKPRRIILCIWDLHVYEMRRELPQGVSKEQLLRETTNRIERLLKHLNIDYKIILLSDAWQRLMARPDLMQLHQKILSTITFRDIQQKSDFPYSLFGETTLSRMNYMIMDFLIATHLHELFPEHAQSMPKIYVASNRFKVFADHIMNAFRENYRKTVPPQVEYINFPVIIDEGKIPSLDMGEAQTTQITNNYLKNIKKKDVFLDDFSRILRTQDLQCKDIDEFSMIFNEYMLQLRKITQTGEVKKDLPSLFIETSKSFEEKIKPLNDIKLNILQLCDGKKTSYEIAQLLKLKPVTVSVYFGRLRAMGLISEGRRPKLLYRNVVIDLKG